MKLRHSLSGIEAFRCQTFVFRRMWIVCRRLAPLVAYRDVSGPDPYSAGKRVKSARYLDWRSAPIKRLSRLVFPGPKSRDGCYRSPRLSVPHAGCDEIKRARHASPSDADTNKSARDHDPLPESRAQLWHSPLPWRRITRNNFQLDR